MNAKEKLLEIKNNGFFTAGQTFDEFISGLCKRYTRVHQEFLPVNDLDYIVQKLEEKGILEESDNEYLDLQNIQK